MKNKTFLLIIMICTIAVSSALSQEDEDSTEVHHHFWKHGKFEFNLFHDNFKGDPTVSLLYGLSGIKQKDLPQTPSKPNLFEFKIGYTDETETPENENILRYKYRFALLSNFSTDLSGNNSSKDFKNDMWRFGIGRSFGYGYKIGSASVTPYHAYSLDWTRVKFYNMPSNPVEQQLLNPFNNTFRFGTSTEGGIRVKIAPHFIIESAYERSIIFPKHLFWKWAGSVLIEAGGQVALDNFIKEIMDSSPYAAPVMSFLLKNALSYGIYELRQSKMNWPFNTVAPLAYDQFKFGVTLSF